MLIPRRVALAFVLVTECFGQESLSGSRTFGLSCSEVWADALQVFVKNGFGPKTAAAPNERGGFVDLEWRKGESLAGWGGIRQMNALVCQYTRQKCKGFWTQYEGFRIADATALFAATPSGCKVDMQISYHGMEERAFQGTRWWILQSNGSFESTILEEVGQRTKLSSGHSVALALAPLKQPPPPSTAPATLALTSNPAGAEIEMDGKYVGSTPSTLKVQPGSRGIVLRKAGYQPWGRTLDVAAEASLTIAADLEPQVKESPNVITVRPRQ